MAKLEKWEVTLEITIDRSAASEPDLWLWRDLLDLAPHETVKVKAAFIEEVEEDD